jgi:hypothetical protein
LQRTRALREGKQKKFNNIAQIACGKTVFNPQVVALFEYDVRKTASAAFSEEIHFIFIPFLCIIWSIKLSGVEI